MTAVARASPGTWAFDRAPAKRALAKCVRLIEGYSVELGQPCAPERAEELMLLLAKGGRVQRRLMALALSRQWRKGIERPVLAIDGVVGYSPRDPDPYLATPGYFARATPDEKAERARLRKLRLARKGGLDKAVTAAPPPQVPATKFKGSKGLSRLLGGTQGTGYDPDPVVVSARRLGLSREEYFTHVEQESMRRKVAQNAERAAERAGLVPWTPDRVWGRLVGAWEVVFRTPVERGPRGFGRAMPEYIHEFEDMVGRGDDREVKSARWYLRYKGPPGEDEYALMAEALEWPKLVDDVSVAKLITMAPMWEAWGANLRKKLKVFGLSQYKYYKMKDEALDEIVAKLTSE